MKNKTTIWNYLLTPFRYIAGIKSLIIGIIMMILLALSGFVSDTHFDGALDIHYGCSGNQIGIYRHLMYQLISWICIVITMYVSALFFSKSSIRLVDMAGTIAMARIPLFIAAFIGFIPGIHLCELANLSVINIEDVMVVLQNNMFWIILVTIIIIPVIIWYIILLYNAYSVSANLKGIKGIGIFIISLIISEILSKILMYFIL